MLLAALGLPWEGPERGGGNLLSVTVGEVTGPWEAGEGQSLVCSQIVWEAWPPYHAPHPALPCPPLPHLQWGWCGQSCRRHQWPEWLSLCTLPLEILCAPPHFPLPKKPQPGVDVSLSELSRTPCAALLEPEGT